MYFNVDRCFVNQTVYDCLIGTCIGRIVLSCDGLMLGSCAKTYFVVVVVILVIVCCSFVLFHSCYRAAFVYLCWLFNCHLCYSASTLTNNNRVTTINKQQQKTTTISSDVFVRFLNFRAWNVSEIILSKLSLRL